MICIECGKEFKEATPWNRYCSKECKLRRNRRARKEQYKPKYPEQERICPECGAKFVAKGRKKFCSSVCARKYNNRGGKFGYLVPGAAGLDRGYTAEEAAHVRKWYREGLSIKQLGQILNRSEDNIKKALAGMEK